MAGISVVQGLHQVAQKFTSTILPRYWLRLCDLPSKSIRLKSSACIPTVGTREPILHPSKAGNPTNATSSAITTNTVLVLLDLMSASSPSTATLTMGSAFGTSVQAQRQNWFPAPDCYWNPAPPESLQRNILRSFSS